MELSKQFAEIHDLIVAARERVYRMVNTELIDLYWKIGEYIDHRIASEEWGKSVVKNLAEYLKNCAVSRVCVVSLLRTSGGCGNFISHIGMTKISQHC